MSLSLQDPTWGQHAAEDIIFILLHWLPGLRAPVEDSELQRQCAIPWAQKLNFSSESPSMALDSMSTLTSLGKLP